MKKISFLLAILMMLTCLLTSCFETAVDDVPTVISPEDLENYAVVRSEDADTETMKAVSDLLTALNKQYDVKLTYKTDYVDKKDGDVTENYEILVGQTNRAASGTDRYNDYHIGYEGNKIVINGGSTAALKLAIAYFKENCMTDDGIEILPYTHNADNYQLGNLMLGQIPLSHFAVVNNAQTQDDETLRSWLGKKVGSYSVSPDGHNLILMQDNNLGVIQTDIRMEGNDLVLAVSPAQADYSLVLDRFYEWVNGADGNTLSVPGTEIAEYDQYAVAFRETIDEWREMTDLRIAEIRATATTVSTAGKTVYYVSSSAGNDNNTGKSQSSPWKTLSKVNSSAGTNCVVCFKRGDEWRGESLTAKSGVTYTAYGTGAKPILCGSPENGAVASKWIQTDKQNVWYYTGSNKWSDVGNIVFNEGMEDETWGTKVIYQWKDDNTYDFTTQTLFNNGYKSMSYDLQFFHDVGASVTGKTWSRGTGLLYVYSEENPGTRFKSIEFATGGNMISVKVNNVTIDNLCVKYAGKHGVGAGSVDNLKVQNCEFEWIGGVSHQSSVQGRNFQTRLGNAVEVYGSCENYTVQNNYIHQIYDAGITHQIGIDGGSKVYNHTNVYYVDNVIENCVYSIEYFVSGCEASNPSVMTNFHIENNIMWNASKGFCETRPIADRSWGAHIKGRCSATGNRATGYVIKNNYFIGAKDRMVQITSNLYNTDGSDSMPDLSGNVFAMEYGGRFGQLKQTSDTAQVDQKMNLDVVAYVGDKSDGTDVFYFIQK